MDSALIRAAFCILLVSNVAVAAPNLVTPFLGKPGNWNCRSVVLDQRNIIGFSAIPRDNQTVDARILYYRSPGVKDSIELRMMAEEAATLRGEVVAILKKLRPRPIRFDARVADGRCEIYQIVG